MFSKDAVFIIDIHVQLEVVYILKLDIIRFYGNDSSKRHHFFVVLDEVAVVTLRKLPVYKL